MAAFPPLYNYYLPAHYSCRYFISPPLLLSMVVILCLDQEAISKKIYRGRREKKGGKTCLTHVVGKALVPLANDQGLQARLA